MRAGLSRSHEARMTCHVRVFHEELDNVPAGEWHRSGEGGWGAAAQTTGSSNFERSVLTRKLLVAVSGSLRRDPTREAHEICKRHVLLFVRVDLEKR